MILLYSLDHQVEHLRSYLTLSLVDIHSGHEVSDLTSVSITVLLHLVDQMISHLIDSIGSFEPFKLLFKFPLSILVIVHPLMYDKEPANVDLK